MEILYGKNKAKAYGNIGDVKNQQCVSPDCQCGICDCACACGFCLDSTPKRKESDLLNLLSE